MPLEEFEPGILAIERPRTYDIRSRGHRDRLRFFLRSIMSSGSALIFHVISYTARSLEKKKKLLTIRPVL
jgi:hypothetical protein